MTQFVSSLSSDGITVSLSVSVADDALKPSVSSSGSACKESMLPAFVVLGQGMPEVLHSVLQLAQKNLCLQETRSLEAAIEAEEAA